MLKTLQKTILITVIIKDHKNCSYILSSKYQIETNYKHTVNSRLKALGHIGWLITGGLISQGVYKRDVNKHKEITTAPMNDIL